MSIQRLGCAQSRLSSSLAKVIMGFGIVIIFWLFGATIFLVAFLVFAGLGIYGHKKKKSILKWIGIIPASSIVLIGVALVGLIGYGTILSMFPSNVYESVFGISPPDSVTELKSDTFWFADTGSTYLTFKIPEAELSVIIPQRLEEKSPDDFKGNMWHVSGSDAPSWWKFTINQNWKYFQRQHTYANRPVCHRGFASEDEYIGYDTSTNTVYYRFLGID